MRAFQRSLFMILVGFSLAAGAQKSASDDLYKSSSFTSVNSFTSCAEEPVIDKSGTIYD